MDLKNSQPIKPCKYDFFGYCRNFKDKSCPNGQHFSETCHKGQLCLDENCREQKRHPKKCKYISIFGICNLNEDCRYSHYDVSQTILEMEKALQKNNTELAELKNLIKEMTQQQRTIVKKQVEKNFHCHICNKDFISKGGLQRHTNLKHGINSVPQIDINDRKIDGKNDQNLTIKNKNIENEPSDHEKIDFELTCLDDHKKKKIWNKQEIALLVHKRLQNHEKKINQATEDEKNYIKIPRYYKDIEKNDLYEFDELAHFGFFKNKERMTILTSFEKIDPDEKISEITDIGIIQSGPDPELELDNDDDQTDPSRGEDLAVENGRLVD